MLGFKLLGSRFRVLGLEIMVTIFGPSYIPVMPLLHCGGCT